jgi:hypothetical protein
MINMSDDKKFIYIKSVDSPIPEAEKTNVSLKTTNTTGNIEKAILFPLARYICDSNSTSLKTKSSEIRICVIVITLALYNNFAIGIRLKEPSNRRKKPR